MAGPYINVEALLKPKRMTRWHAKQARVRARREKKAAEWKEFEDALFQGLMRRAGLNTQPRGDERAE